MSIVRTAVVAALSVLLLAAASAQPAAATGGFTASAVPTVASVWPFPGSYVRTGVAVTIEVRVTEAVDHVVVHDGATGAELARLTGAPRMPWRYVWTSTAGSVSPDLQPVSTTGEAGAVLRTGYGFDDQPPVIDYLGFALDSGETLPVNDRVGPAGALVVGSQESTWVVNTVWSVDGAVVSNSGQLPWSYPPRDRPYPVRVQLMDGAGNWGERTYSLTVDATGPAVTSVTPANGALVRGSRISSAVQASDAAGIYTAELTGAAPVLTAPYAASLPAGQDGARTLTWTVRDRVGNSTVVHRAVTVDNTRPTVAFATGPANKATVKGTVAVTATASDRYGVAKVQLLINGAVVATDTTAAYSFSVDTTKYGKTITAQLRTYDKAGNYTRTSARTWYRR